MVGVWRGVATSTHVWPAIPGLPGPPLRGLSGRALAPTGRQTRMIQSGAKAASCPWMIQSRGRRFLLLDLPRMIQPGASGLNSPDDALVVLWPLLLVLPRMIQSWALHGLVTASLHHHGLLVLAVSLLLHCLILMAAVPLHRGLVDLISSLHHHGLVLSMLAPSLPGLVLIFASLHHHSLVLFAASLHHCGHIHWSVSLLHLSPVLIIAVMRLLGLVLIFDSLHPHGVVFCVASGHDSLAAPPWPPPLVSFASGRHFPLAASARGLGTPSA